MIPAREKTNPVIYRIHRGDKFILDVASVEAIEQFASTAKARTYDVDIISLEPISGRTSQAWGTVTRHVFGKVTVETHMTL